MSESATPQLESGSTVVAIVDFLARRVDAQRHQLLDQLGDAQRQGRTELDVNDLALKAQLARTKACLAVHHAELFRRASGVISPEKAVI